MKKILLIIFLFAVPLFLSAQKGRIGKGKPKKKTGYKIHTAKRTNKFSGKKANKNRPEYTFGIGAANFLGELGGSNQVGSNFVKDMEFVTTRPSFGVGYRYNIIRRVSVRGGFNYLLVSGSDKLTQEPFRKNRNLSFRSNIYEVSLQAELYFITPQTGHKYKIKNAKGSKNNNIKGYAFVGFGGFFFNPKAQYEGKWVALQPLGTEGQGIKDGTKKYSRFSMAIPYGLGANIPLNTDWSVGLEIGIRKTFTDYIDDVSTVYYEKDAIYKARGKTAADLSDPSIAIYPEEYGGSPYGAMTGLWQTREGEQRGDPKDNDTYMFIHITAAYKIPYKRKTRSKF